MIRACAVTVAGVVAICVLRSILELKVRWFVLASCRSDSKLRNFLVGFLISYRTQTKVLPLDRARQTHSDGMPHARVRLLCAGEIRPKVARERVTLNLPYTF